MNKKFVQKLALFVALAASLVVSFGPKANAVTSLGTPTTQFAASTDPLERDYSDIWDAYDDSDEKGCTKGASGYSWFPCSMNKMLNWASRIVFEIAERFLVTDPDIFKNAALVEGWKVIRNLANLVVIIMLIITIMSQITGVGITNYGVKKALPRIIIVAILINVSIYACRIAVDVMNIAGEAIQNAFEPLTLAARSKINYDPSSKFGAIMGSGTTTILSVVLAFFSTKTFLASGESIILLGLFLAISVAIGALLLFLTIVVRAALVVLLTMTSPLAVVLAVFPGTKKTFNRWFDLFKGVLLCYPMAALMVYGGNFAGTIALAALGLNQITLGPITIPVNVFTLMASAAASIAPIIMLPGLIIKSTGAIGATMQGVARKITGAAQGALGGSAFGEMLQRRAKDRRNALVAGVDKDGNELKGIKKLGRVFRSGSAEERMEAEQALAASRAKRRSEDLSMESGDIEANDAEAQLQYEDLEGRSVGTSNAEIDEEFERILNGGYTPEQMAARIDGSMKYFARQNPKNGAEGVLQKKLDALGDDDLGKRTRQLIAARRLQSSGDMLKAKSPMDYAYYKALRDGDGTARYFDNNGHVSNEWVSALVTDPELGFSAEALSDYAGPTLSALGGFMQRNFSGTGTENARYRNAQHRIRQAYDQMIRTSAYRSNAASDDFEAIRKAIESGKGLNP